jgi:hypothetical protein
MRGRALALKDRLGSFAANAGTGTTNIKIETGLTTGGDTEPTRSTTPVEIRRQC